MPTSELSDALNPHVVQPRSRPSSSYTEHLQPITQPPPQYIPHRSELELAISEPPPPPPRARAQPSAEGVQAVQELLRTLSATREAQEIERARRLAWEHEQEAKYTLRQAEMERQMFEMRHEIASLRSSIAANPSGSMPTLSVSGHQPRRTSSPVSPVSLPSLTQTPFMEASSHQLQNQQTYYAETSNSHNIQDEHPDLMTIGPPSPITPLSPTASAKPSTPRLASIPQNRRKRQTPDISTDEGEETSATESSTTSRRPIKRANRHDTRCLTIHQAMRAHILRLMEVEADQDLPESHVEGVPLEPHDPTRFVWDKTTKQSVHNSRMKARVLADLKSNRRLYKHVPDRDFGKKTLESVFDQAFVTFRQKFKAQSDAGIAMSHKKKEDSKARRSRRVSRKKIKLTNRAEARMRLKAFEHVTFDGALQIECMSSEESDCDGPSDILRIRRLPWRSSRLQRFYNILDDEETLDKSQKPKRGSGKKERCLGLPKEGFFIPPEGVASWMISRRWINMSVIAHPELLDALKNIVDPPGFVWDYFPDLGGESEDDELQTIQDLNLQNGHYNPLGDTPSTSSLHNALASR